MHEIQFGSPNNDSTLSTLGIALNLFTNPGYIYLKKNNNNNIHLYELPIQLVEKSKFLKLFLIKSSVSFPLIYVALYESFSITISSLHQQEGPGSLT